MPDAGYEAFAKCRNVVYGEGRRPRRLRLPHPTHWVSIPTDIIGNGWKPSSLAPLSLPTGFTRAVIQDELGLGSAGRDF